MRRAMITMRPSGGAPFTVGNPLAAGVSIGQRVAVDKLNPAPRSGTITSVDFQAVASGTLYVMTGNISGSNFTVTAISGPLSVTAGANASLAVSLAIDSGGHIGYYSTAAYGVMKDGVGSLGYAGPTSLPSPGTVITLAPYSGTLSELGQGVG